MKSAIAGTFMRAASSFDRSGYRRHRSRSVRRRAGDAHVHFAGAGIAHHLHDLHAGGAAHDRIVDQHDPLAFHQRAVGVVLALHIGMARAVRRLDEGAADIVRADDAQLERNAGLLRVAERGRHAAVGHGDHQIGIGGAFDGELRADRLAHLIDRTAAHQRSGRLK
jgi:hypothetical protein